ncbi:MAG: ASCH domain-containing protein [Clostridiales bacterium]|nr:ASCH domain-containing protein [Clostridiales bacterium]
MDIKTYWNKYKEKSGTDKLLKKAYYFCDNKEEAEELANLVLEGKKRATASIYLMYEIENEPLPKVGDLNIITDFYDEPKCIIETTDVNIAEFKDVSPEFANTEGEGDSSLEYWKYAHRSFFTKELLDMDKCFTEDMLVVCEKFKVVYK